MLGAKRNHCLCLPEAMVDKIECKMPQLEEQISTVIAKEERRSKQELIQEQLRILEECHDKTNVYPRNHPKSQAPSVSQTHRASDEPSVLGSSGTGPTYNFYVGSMVQIPSSDEDNPFKYGVIQWIGLIPRMLGRVAGIELVSY